MLQNISIKARLIFMVALLALLMIAVSATGIARLHSAYLGLQSMHDDRLVAISQLDRVSRALLNLQHLLDTSDEPVGRADLTVPLTDAEQAWQAYMGTALTRQEQAEAAQFIAARDGFLQQYAGPALDAAGARAAQPEARRRAFQSLSSRLQSLMTLQLDVGAQQSAAARSSFERYRTLALVLLSVALVASVAIGSWLVRSISRPLDHAVRLAQGVAAGDLTHDIAVHGDDEMGTLLRALQHMNGSLRAIVGQVRIGTDAMAAASCQIASGNLNLSQRTEHQADALTSTAAALTQLNGAVQQNADHAARAELQAQDALDVARRGCAAVRQVSAAMGTIQAAADSIGGIVSVHDSIADQARRMAARASHAAATPANDATGLAALAADSLALAERCQANARLNRTLIAATTSKIITGHRLAIDASHRLEAVVGNMCSVGQLVSEISNASRVQSSSLDQIHRAVVDMDDATQQNAVMVEEAAAAAASLNTHAHTLSLAVGVFRLPATPTTPPPAPYY